MTEIRKIDELNDEIIAKVAELNKELRNENGVDAKTLKSLEDSARSLIDDWNTMRRHELFDAWLTEEKPLEYALIQRDVDQKSLKYRPAGDKHGEEYNVKSRDVMFNVMEYAEYAAKSGIYVFNDETWKDNMEAITKALVLRVARDVENKDAEKGIEAEYCLKEGSLAIYNEAKSNRKDPTSNKSLKAAFQVIVEKMLGDGVVVFQNKDLKFVLLVMSSRGKGKASLSAPRLSTMISILTDCLHRALCNKEYTIEVRQESFAEKAKSAPEKTTDNEK